MLSHQGLVVRISVDPVQDEDVPDRHGDHEPLSDGLLGRCRVNLRQHRLSEVDDRLGDLPGWKCSGGHGRLKYRNPSPVSRLRSVQRREDLAELREADRRPRELGEEAIDLID